MLICSFLIWSLSSFTVLKLFSQDLHLLGRIEWIFFRWVKNMNLFWYFFWHLEHSRDLKLYICFLDFFTIYLVSRTCCYFKGFFYREVRYSLSSMGVPFFCSITVYWESWDEHSFCPNSSSSNNIFPLMFISIIGISINI